MLLASTESVPSEPGWVLEVKWDGMRAQVRVANRRLVLRSLSGVDWTRQFPELDEVVAATRGLEVILDGELVCFDRTGHPDFARLRTRLTRGRAGAAQAAAESPATFVAFDVLHLDGHAVRRLPYGRRRELLDELALAGQHHTTPPVYRAGHDDLLAATRTHGLEGIVAKRLAAPYVEGRRAAAWRKLKHRHVETLIVTAWEPGPGHGDGLPVSRPDPATGRLRNAGRVPLRVPPTQRDVLRQSLAAIERPPRRARGRRAAAGPRARRRGRPSRTRQRQPSRPAPQDVSPRPLATLLADADQSARHQLVEVRPRVKPPPHPSQSEMKAELAEPASGFASAHRVPRRGAGRAAAVSSPLRRA